MRRLIITGAGGFLGSNVVKAVLGQDIFDEVIAVTLGAEEMKTRFEENAKLAIFEADAIQNHEVVLKSEDIVLNCAYPRAMKGADVTAGLDYVESVFQASADAKVAGIINISSQSVYDPQRDHPAVETDVPVLTDEYSIGKYCMEMLLRNICRDIPYTNIRLASLIGPGFDVRVPNKMVKNAIEKKIIIAEKCNKKFGYLDVIDASKAITKILALDKKIWKHIYNLGGERAYSIVEMAELVAKTVERWTGLSVLINKIEGEGTYNSSLNSSLLEGDIKRFQETKFEDSIHRVLIEVIEKGACDGKAKRIV